MALRLYPFPAGSAGVVSGWAMTNEEVIMWCGHPGAPVPAEQISAWAREDGVEQFGLYRDERLVAYGELWVDDAEAEADRLFALPDFSGTPAARGKGVYAVDASSYFSRPGPRIVDGLEILAWAVHPEAFPEPPDDRVARVGR